MTDSTPIDQPAPESIVDSKLTSDVSIRFNPLILPVSLQYHFGKGFSIVQTGEHQIMTPLGSVGINYSLGTTNNRAINGYTVSSGDFVIGLINTTTHTKQVFKIEGFRRLKVITEGKTSIDAQAGYVEIDVTDARVKELKFIDDTKFSIVNNTNKVRKFFLGIKTSDGSLTWNKCEVEPSCYKSFPRFDVAKSFNELLSGQYMFKIENDDSNDDRSSSMTLGVAFGEVCHILADKDGTGCTLEKSVN